MVYLLCCSQVLPPVNIHSGTGHLCDHPNGSTIFPNNGSYHVTRHQHPVISMHIGDNIATQL